MSMHSEDMSPENATLEAIREVEKNLLTQRELIIKNTEARMFAMDNRISDFRELVSNVLNSHASIQRDVAVMCEKLDELAKRQCPQPGLCITLEKDVRDKLAKDVSDIKGKMDKLDGGTAMAKYVGNLVSAIVGGGLVLIIGHFWK